MSDIDTIRERHRNAGTRCEECASSWPCDTRVVLDTLDRALVAAEGLAEADKRHRDAHEMASWYEDRARAARADAERLAGALRFCSDRLVNSYGADPNIDYILTAREALRLHESKR